MNLLTSSQHNAYSSLLLYRYVSSKETEYILRISFIYAFYTSNSHFIYVNKQLQIQKCVSGDSKTTQRKQ